MEKVICIDGVEYVPKVKGVFDGNRPIVCVRTYAAGVFVGALESEDHFVSGKQVVLSNARRIWRWAGAASLSQLAMEGVKKPNECKFPMPVIEVTLNNVVETIPVTRVAMESIESVPVWEE